MSRPIQTVLDEHRESLLAAPGVLEVAVGEAQGRPAIVVRVARRTRAASASLPASLGGYPVVVVGAAEPHAGRRG
jgi:hypothetical protein